MAGRITPPDDGVIQEALELRHSIEELAEQCRRMYEEANRMVERLRRVNARLPASGLTGRTER